MAFQGDTFQGDAFQDGGTIPDTRYVRAPVFTRPWTNEGFRDTSFICPTNPANFPVVAVSPPFNPVDFPARGLSWTDKSWTASLDLPSIVGGLTLGKPFNQADWPSRGLSWTDKSHTWSFNLSQIVGAPFRQADWPVPQRAPLANQSFVSLPQQQPVVVVQLPFNQADWPSRSLTWTDKSWVQATNLVLGVPVVTPDTRTIRGPVFTRSWSYDNGPAVRSQFDVGQNLLNTLLSTPPVQAPFSLKDWPNPRGAEQRDKSHSWSFNLSQIVGSPFRQADWPSRGLTWTDKSWAYPSNPATIPAAPVGTKPFLQSDWPSRGLTWSDTSWLQATNINFITVLANCGLLLNDGTSFVLLNQRASAILLDSNDCPIQPNIPVPLDVGGGISGGYWSKGKWHALRDQLARELVDAWAAQEAVERKAKEETKRKKKALQEAAKAAEEVLLAAQERAVETYRLTSALEAAASAKRTADVIMAAKDAVEIAHYIMNEIEEEELLLLMSS